MNCFYFRNYMHYLKNNAFCILKKWFKIKKKKQSFDSKNSKVKASTESL